MPVGYLDSFYKGDSMSHFTMIKTQFRDLVILKKAIKDLNYTFTDEKNLTILGYQHKEEAVDLAIHLKDGYDVGFKMNRQTENYDVVADWYGVSIDSDKFVNQLKQRYAYHNVVHQVEQHGLLIGETTHLDDGTIKLVVRKWE